MQAGWKSEASSPALTRTIKEENMAQADTQDTTTASATDGRGALAELAASAARSSKAKSSSHGHCGTRNAQARLPASDQNEAYLYEIHVDGVLRYIGKGRKVRMYSHMKAARCTEKRCGTETDHLSPHLHRKLVDSIRRGAKVEEIVVLRGLSDKEAYRLESQRILEMHRDHSGQLWNTIDERFMDPQFLPERWDDAPEPLYRLPRPLRTREDGSIYGSVWGKR